MSDVRKPSEVIELGRYRINSWCKYSHGYQVTNDLEALADLAEQTHDALRQILAVGGEDVDFGGQAAGEMKKIARVALGVKDPG
jgi:hypothetical protein